MKYHLRLACIVGLSFFASAVLVQAQSTGFSRTGFAKNSGSYQLLGPLPTFFSAYPAGSSPEAYAFQGNSSGGSGGQQEGYGARQNQGASQNLNMNRNQNQNQNNQGQGKEEAPPEKPHYLTYTVKQKSLQEQAKTGKALAVDFKSVPAGAVITVDGYFVGRTPTTARIPVGKHLVSINKWGYRSWEKELDVTGSRTLSVNPTLHKDW